MDPNQIKLQKVRQRLQQEREARDDYIQRHGSVMTPGSHGYKVLSNFAKTIGDLESDERLLKQMIEQAQG